MGCESGFRKRKQPINSSDSRYHTILGISCYIEEVWSRPEHDLLYLHGLPVQVQRCIYTTNWIERLNRKYKRTIKMRTSMPSDKSALFLLASAAMEETKTTYARKIYQWKFWKHKKEKWIKNKEKRNYTLFRTLPIDFLETPLILTWVRWVISVYKFGD